MMDHAIHHVIHNFDHNFDQNLNRVIHNFDQNDALVYILKLINLLFDQLGSLS